MTDSPAPRPAASSVSAPDPPGRAPEAAMLLAYLDFYRAVLLRKAAGLDDAALARRLPGHPSPMTLGGMLAHLAYVEDEWFTRRIAGAPAPPPWADAPWEQDRDWDWHWGERASGAEARALFAAACARSRAVAAELGLTSGADLDAGLAAGDASLTRRWALVHLVEEYARDAGHADLLREAIDGAVGD
ncbi:DUF664 domain-containing protein [Brevibacterium sp. BRM-1]|uniref:mycothiol transferase n=1 Tax=Brevibacterium sp. BRM-1 TaxID=2999062 RepID=UPI002281EA3D|nr:DUF664 domain-containing protein [Brevibacterium sp. BRM-1]WAL40142.1 DUF664 domain-containing protein [Brevibacterium sp. BRM-1]